MSSSFVDYLVSGKYVNDKNLDVQNVRIESASAGLVLATDANKNVVSSVYGTNLFLSKWGSTYQSYPYGNTTLPLTVGGGLSSIVRVNTVFDVVASAITAPAGNVKGNYVVSVSYYTGQLGQAGISLRLDGSEISRFFSPNDTAPAGYMSFDTFVVINDDLTHSFTLVFVNGISAQTTIQLGNVSVSIVKIA